MLKYYQKDFSEIMEPANCALFLMFRLITLKQLNSLTAIYVAVTAQMGLMEDNSHFSFNIFL